MSLLLSIFYFFYFSVIGVYVIFMPKVLSTLGYSAQEIGVIFAAAPLVRFILPILFLRGLELNRRVFYFALVVMVTSATGFYFSVEYFYALLCANLFLGVGLSLVLPYVELIALEEIGKEHYGRVRLFGSIGFVLVALVLVKVLSDSQVALNFLLVLTYLSALSALFTMRGTEKKKSQEEKILNDINPLKDFKLWGALVLMQMSFGAFYNFFTIYTTDNGIDMQTTIYLWSFGVLVEIVMLYIQGGFLKKNLLFILQLTILITVFRWLLLFVFVENIYVLYFSQSLHAFSFALFHSAAIAYLFQLYKHRALAQQFFSGITYGLGGFTGALLAGFIYERFASYIFLSSAFIAMVSFLFIYLWAKERREELL